MGRIVVSEGVADGVLHLGVAVVAQGGVEAEEVVASELHGPSETDPRLGVDAHIPAPADEGLTDIGEGLAVNGVVHIEGGVSVDVAVFEVGIGNGLLAEGTDDEIGLVLIKGVRGGGPVEIAIHRVSGDHDSGTVADIVLVHEDFRGLVDEIIGVFQVECGKGTVAAGYYLVIGLDTDLSDLVFELRFIVVGTITEFQFIEIGLVFGMVGIDDVEVVEGPFVFE